VYIILISFACWMDPTFFFWRISWYSILVPLYHYLRTDGLLALACFLGSIFHDYSKPTIRECEQCPSYQQPDKRNGTGVLRLEAENILLGRVQEW